MCSDLEFAAMAEKLARIIKTDNQSYRDYFTILRKSVLRHFFDKHQHVLSVHSDPSNSVEYPMTPVNFHESVRTFLERKHNASFRQAIPEMLSFQKWGTYPILTGGSDHSEKN